MVKANQVYILSAAIQDSGDCMQDTLSSMAEEIQGRNAIGSGTICHCSPNVCLPVDRTYICFSLLLQIGKIFSLNRFLSNVKCVCIYAFTTCSLPRVYFSPE